MSDSKAQLDRRDFLRCSAATAVGSTFGIPGVAQGDAPAPARYPRFKARPTFFSRNSSRAGCRSRLPPQEANWAASTDVSEAHTADAGRQEPRAQSLCRRTEVIDTVRRLSEHKDELHDLTRPPAREGPPPRRRGAGHASPRSSRPAPRPRRSRRPPRTGSPSLIRREGQRDDRLGQRHRPRSWSSRATSTSGAQPGRPPRTIGRPLRDGLLRLRDLRNKVAQAMGFDDFFALQVADYGMTVPEMIAALRPPDRRRPGRSISSSTPGPGSTLAKRYRAEVPRDGKIPAHWLPNRWGQNWPSLVEGVDMDAPFKGKPKEFITEQAERFYVSLGFPRLPKSFWEKSDLYPADPKSGRKKNSHASAWHINLRDDVRSLMSIEPDSRWFTTAHHELGHIYYYISYSTPAVPVPASRRGKSRISRGDRRLDRPGGRPAALSQAGRAAWPRGREGRCGDVPARHGAGRFVGGLSCPGRPA